MTQYKCDLFSLLIVWIYGYFINGLVLDLTFCDNKPLVLLKDYCLFDSYGKTYFQYEI